jgi:hypothetical protein
MSHFWPSIVANSIHNIGAYKVVVFILLPYLHFARKQSGNDHTHNITSHEAFKSVCNIPTVTNPMLNRLRQHLIASSTNYVHCYSPRISQIAFSIHTGRDSFSTCSASTFYKPCKSIVMHCSRIFFANSVDLYRQAIPVIFVEPYQNDPHQ